PSTFFYKTIIFNTYKTVIYYCNVRKFFRKKRCWVEISLRKQVLKQALKPMNSKNNYKRLSFVDM
ncbi:hypothetical protein KKD51_01900, partial [Patescibacteria group bacterium]|nr:hypothetical protein [Patescibacteria group bacterium]